MDIFKCVTETSCRIEDIHFYNPHDAMIPDFSLFFLESAHIQLFFSAITCVK